MADTVVIDGKGHLLGRLASICAKQLLNGKKIAVVRAEQIVVSGSRKYISHVNPIHAFLIMAYCLSISVYACLVL